MSNNPVRIQDLISGDGELLIRPMSIEAVYKRNFHNAMWDCDFYLSNGNLISITIDDDIVDDVIKRLSAFPKHCENASSSSDFAFYFALASVVFSSVAFGFCVCLFLTNHFM